MLFLIAKSIGNQRDKSLKNNKTAGPENIPADLNFA